MPIVLQDQSGLSEGIGSFFGNLASGLERKAQGRLMNQQKGALNSVLQQADLSSQEGQRDFLSQYTSAGGDLKDALSIVKQQQSDPIREWMQNRLAGGQAQQVPGEPPQQVGALDTSLQAGGQAQQGAGVGLDQVLGDVPEEVILAASMSPDPAIRASASALNQFKSQGLKRDIQNTKNWTEERNFHTKLSDKSVERANQMRSMVPRKEFSFNMARQAVESGDIGAFSPANIAERLGIKEFQNASGTQLITASKEHLIPNLSRLSAKAQNQWLQQLFSSMFPEIGKTEFANSMALTMLEEENRMDKLEIEMFDKLSAEDEVSTEGNGRSGYIKRDIDRRVDEQMASVREQATKRVSYKTREIWEREKGLDKLVGKKVVRGTPMTLQMGLKFLDKYGSKEKAASVAKKLGYTIPTAAELKSYVGK